MKLLALPIFVLLLVPPMLRAADPAEQPAIDHFRKLGAKVVVGPEGHVTTVELYEINMTNDDLAYVRKLPYVERLVVWGSDINNAGLAHLQGLRHLKDLVLEVDRMFQTEDQHGRL